MNGSTKERIQRPFQLALAQMVCHYLPPYLALKLGHRLYPKTQAYQDSYPFSIRSRTGSIYRGNTSDFHSYDLAIYGYGALLNWALAAALCQQGDAIVEIGANVGTETVAFSDIVGATGKVFAFEPYPVNVKVLHDALSSSQYDNVEIIPYAVGHASSKVVFSPPPNTHSSGIGYVSLQLRTNEQKGLEVQCVTLDSMMDKLPPAKMIFIDVEGFEPFVLQGAHHYLQLGWPHLLMEAKPKWLVRAGTSLQDLYQELTLLGYQVFDTKGPHLTLIEADPKNDRGTDWLCIHRSQQSQQEIVYTAQKYLKKVFLLPFIFNVNPLSNFIRTKKTIFC